MNEEYLIDLYGKKRGKEIYHKDVTAKKIIKEAIALVEKRWAEEFPEDDLTREDEKPYAYDWFNGRPNGC